MLPRSRPEHALAIGVFFVDLGVRLMRQQPARTNRATMNAALAFRFPITIASRVLTRVDRNQLGIDAKQFNIELNKQNKTVGSREPTDRVN